MALIRTGGGSANALTKTFTLSVNGTTAVSTNLVTINIVCGGETVVTKSEAAYHSGGTFDTVVPFGYGLVSDTSIKCTFTRTANSDNFTAELFVNDVSVGTSTGTMNNSISITPSNDVTIHFT